MRGSLPAGVTEQNEVAVINITCFGTLYSQFGVFDEGTRVEGFSPSLASLFWLSCLPCHGPREEGHPAIDREAPFQNGVIERRSALLQNFAHLVHAQ